MYQRHFGLSGEPFSIAPDPRLLFMSERHREALAHLLYGMRGGGGFVVLTGDVGTGKTTICRCFLQQVPDGCHVAYVFNPAMNVLELLRTVCAEFGVALPAAAPAPSRKDCVDALNEYLLRSHAGGHGNVLIIDEAQNLSAPVLEQLRLLTNLETDQRKLLQIVLIGQPELRRLLARPELEQVAQRVIARYHLQPLAGGEIAQYVGHRLAAAGLQGPLPFDRAALRCIARLSRGIPRRINLLCDRALLGAFALGRTRVDRSIVERAAVEVFGGADDHARGPRRRAPLWFGAGALSAVTLLGAAGWAVWTSRPETPAALAHADSALPAAPLAAAAGEGGVAAGPAAAAATAAAAAEDAVDGLRRHLATVAADDAAAWQQLAARWDVTLPPGEPCAGAAAKQLQCHRGNGGSLALLRKLDRPAILVLRDEDGPPSPALLTALGPKDATLQFADASFTVPAPVVAGLWAGEFVTLWRPPPGYRGAALNPSDPASARWLTQQLEPLALPAAARSAGEAAVGERLRGFQAAQGLPADGLAGPLTLMQLNRAAGVDEPRLATP